MSGVAIAHDLVHMLHYLRRKSIAQAFQWEVCEETARYLRFSYNKTAETDKELENNFCEKFSNHRYEFLHIEINYEMALFV